MLPIQSLHHLSFRVPDVDAATVFYRDLLGFAQIERPNLGIPGAWLSGHGVEIHLLGVAGGEDGASAGGLNPTRNHVAFRVEDLGAVREKLAAAGLEILDGGFGRDQLWVTDPGGNLIEFIAP